MKKRKFTKKEVTALVVLIVLMVAVVAVGAILIINNINTANQNASNTQHTTVDATVLTDNNPSDTNSDSPKNTESDNKSLSSKNSSPKSDAKDVKTNKNNSLASSSSSTKSKTSTKTPGSNKKPNSLKKPNTVETVAPDTNPTHASNKVCKVNGKKCYVGDTITIVLNIKTPKVLENFQGSTAYDSSFLKYESSKANVNGIVNNSGDCLYYNGSDIGRGYDFTNTGSIYYATFKVLKTGSTKIENSIKVLSDRNSKAVSVDDCKITIDIFD